MTEGIKVPLSFPGAPESNLTLKEMGANLSRLQEKLQGVKVGSAEWSAVLAELAGTQQDIAAAQKAQTAELAIHSTTTAGATENHSKYTAALRATGKANEEVAQAEAAKEEALKNTKTAFERVRGALTENIKSLDNFASKAKALNEVAEFAGRMGNAIAGTVKFFAQSAATAEQHGRALHQLGDAYSDVAAATNGTVTAEQAMVVQGRLSQAQLDATGNTLAAVTSAGREFALTTGGDATQATEQLTEALIAGEADGLRKFGISIAEGTSKAEAFKQGVAQLTQRMNESGPSARTMAEDIAGITSELGRLVGGLANAGAKMLGFTSGLGDVRNGLVGLRMAMGDDAEHRQEISSIQSDTAANDRLNAGLNKLRSFGLRRQDISGIVKTAVAGGAEGSRDAATYVEGLLSAMEADSTSIDDVRTQAQGYAQLDATQRAARAEGGMTQDQRERAQAIRATSEETGLDVSDVTKFFADSEREDADSARRTLIAQGGLNLQNVRNRRDNAVIERVEQLRIEQENAKVEQQARRQLGMVDEKGRKKGSGQAIDPATIAETEQTAIDLILRTSAGGHGIDTVGLSGADSSREYVIKAAEELETAFVDAGHRAIKHREESEIAFAQRRIQLASSAAEKILEDDKRKAEEEKREREKLEREAEKEKERRATVRGKFTDILAAPDSGFGQDFRTRLQEDLMQGRTSANDQFGMVGGLRAGAGDLTGDAVQIALDEAKARTEVTRAYQEYTRQLGESMDVQRQFGAAFGNLIELNKTGTQSLAEFSAQGIGSLTQGLKTHFAAILTGKETVGEAFKSMVHELTLSLASEAFVRAIMETAHGIAALASIALAPTAPGHFAAAGLYATVAGLGGLAAAATAPAAASTASSAGGSGGSSRVPALGGASNDNAGPAMYVFNYQGTAFATGGEIREWVHGQLRDVALNRGVPREFSDAGAMAA